MLYQQGDVVVQAVEKLPAGCKPVAPVRGRFILDAGEATGHAHAVQDAIKLYEQGGVLYCQALQPFTITHEEHLAVTIPPGRYQIRKVREYAHFAEEALEKERLVRD